MNWQSIAAMGSWAWIVVGLALAAAEIVVPGAFLIWIGLAAVATGLIEAIFHFGSTWNLIILALLTFVFVLIGRKVYGGVSRVTDQPFLNRRAEALIGREFVLDHPIEHGVGRIRVDDSVWRVAGPDLPFGTRVRVTASMDGVDLRVEKV